MNRLTGLSLVIFGFVLPFLLKKIFPTFLYTSTLISILFLMGFLLILSPSKILNKWNSYLRWARFAIWAHIIVSVLFFIYLHLLYYFDIHHLAWYYLTSACGFINNPVDYIFDIFIPKPTMQRADGSILITFTFRRMLLTKFFSLVVYSTTGAILNLNP